MAVVAPPILVTAPALVPPRFGLLSVADIVSDANPHWVHGIEYQHNPLPGAASSSTQCAAGPSTPKVVPNGMPTVTAAPIIVWSGFSCSHTGLDRAEIEQYARAKLAASEGPFIESQVWGDADTSFMDAPATPSGSTALSPLDAVGVLEGWLWNNYGGTGALHVGRRWAPYLFKAKAVEVVSGKAVTRLGTPVSFGNYPGSDPDGDAADPGQAWIVATGQVQARRSEVAVHTANGDSYFTPETNTVLGLAERTYVLTWDAVTAAVLVDWEA